MFQADKTMQMCRVTGSRHKEEGTVWIKDFESGKVVHDLKIGDSACDVKEDKPYFVVAGWPLRE